MVRRGSAIQWAYDEARELRHIKIDERERNMCKAIEDLKKDSWIEGKAEGKAEGIEKGMEKGKAEGIVEGVERTIFSLRREGYLKKEDAASKLHLSIDEYCSREDLFFHDSAPLVNS